MSDKAFYADVLCMVPVWVTAMESNLVLAPYEENTCSKVIFPKAEGGISVAEYLNTLGIKTSLYGFAGGKTGELMKNHYERLGIDTVFEDTEREISFKTVINYPTGQSTSYVFNDLEHITVSKYFSLLKKIKNRQHKPDCMIITGKSPFGLEKGIYADIIRSSKEKNVPVITDFSGYELLNAMKEFPALIVCDYSDLANMTQRSIESYSDALSALRTMPKKTAIMCVCGTKGAILYCNSFFGLCQWRKNGIANPYAKSALIAGFISACDYSSCDLEYALKYACACFQASDMYGNLADKGEIKKYFTEMTVKIY